MARATDRVGVSAKSKSEGEYQSTRQQLLEVAGQVFAEKGFERSTAKEISERARTNTAAVNYHFGGIEGLHAAVLEEAKKRAFSIEAIEKAVTGKTDPKEKLEIVFGIMVETLLGPVSSSWVIRVLGRDMVTPIVASEGVKDQMVVPRVQILRRFVGDFMGLSEDHPAVARACISIMAPFSMLVLADRRRMKRALPAMGLGPTDAKDLAHHLAQFAVGGMEAVAREMRQKSRPKKRRSGQIEI